MYGISASCNASTVENLVLETISLEYHEVLSAAFGHQVEENKHNALEKYKGQYVLVVDGSIPLKITVFIAWLPVSRLWITSAKRRKAQQPLSLSVPALRGAVLPQLELTQLAQSACRSSTGQNRYQYSRLPAEPAQLPRDRCAHHHLRQTAETGWQNRPTFAYGRLIHEHCERRPHFDAGRFAKEFGDEGHREGWCLYHLGCKGQKLTATAQRCNSAMLAACGR